MTGYAFIEQSTTQFTFSVEIKSLNSKYIETYVNLPRVIRTEEDALARMLKSSFERGKIELTIDIYDWQETRPVSINGAVIEKYYKELSEIHRRLNVVKPLDFESILGLEGVTTKEKSSISGRSMALINECISRAVKTAVKMRRVEALSINADITDSIDSIARNCSEIKKMSADNAKSKMSNLRDKIAELCGNLADQSRIQTEIALMADKLDINEEIIRLNDHIKKFKSVQKQKGQIGKTLDFLSQEMFREINTIASKSNSSNIAHAVVDVKNHIDKIREHCRNVV